MAMTSTTQTDLYRFFAVAFGAAPGVTYMEQLGDAAAAGMTTQQIVNVFTTKSQFTDVYHNYLTDTQFATLLVNNVVQGSASAAAKASAVSDIVAAINSGYSRGDVIYQVFENLAAKDPSDPTWGGTATLLANEVNVARYFTETLGGNSTDLSLLRSVLASVTATSDTSTPAAMNALINPAALTAVPGPSLMLTTGLDNLTSFAAGTTFTANIVDNTNTFQSGDKLVGTGAGNVLNADLGNSAAFAILATTKGIQTINITAEAQATSSLFHAGSAVNNVADLPVQINALRMTDVTNWGDVQSRADVVLENISLPNGNASSDITSAVTFTMRDTQPGTIFATAGEGNVSTVGPSFRAYFDPQALKKQGPNSTTTVTIGTGDSAKIVGGVDTFATNPQNNVPYTGFSILRNGVAIKINFSAQDVANLQGNSVTIGGVTATPAAGSTPGTQADLTTAITNALAAYNLVTGSNISATAVPSGFDYYSADGIHRFVTSYTLSEPNVVLKPPSGDGWTAENGLPAITASAAEIVPGQTSSVSFLITSNLIVDNVGQGGYPQFQNYAGSTEGAGGDVIIGSMATSGGVQQINIDVQRTSWNHSVQTTNNMLQVVNISSDAKLSPTTGGQGYAIGAEIATNAQNMVDWTAPGVFVDTNGLRDVQTINAKSALGAFNGSLEIGETIDYQGFVKYLAGATGVVPFSITLGDQSNGFNVPGFNAPFNSVNLAIDSNVAGSGNFTETITGGTANDQIKVAVFDNNGALAQNGAWVDAQTALDNLVINAGSGNNTVIFAGAGAAQISTLAGNDTVYIDNTAGGANYDGSGGQGTGLVKEVWVSNTTTATSFLPIAPTAVETTHGKAAVAQVETAFWTGAQNLTGTAQVVTETVATYAADPQGISVTINTATAGTVFTSQAVGQDVLDAYNDYHGNTVAGTNTTVLTTAYGALAGTMTWSSGILTEVYTLSTGNTITVVIGGDYAVTQSATDIQQGSNTLTSTASGVTNVWGTGPVVNQITTLGTAGATEQQTVTWHDLQGNGATETIGGIVVTDIETGGASLISAQTIAADVYFATPGTLYTDNTNHITVMVPASGATHWTVTGYNSPSGTNVLTYGTANAVYSGTNPLVGTSTVGTLTGVIDTTVSLDQYGNLTTNAQYQTGAVPHTFTGSGEMVTVSYEGYSVKVLVTPETAITSATYTSTDVNNAIAAAVNNDPVMSKLLHVTQGSANESLIFNSLVDGYQNAPTIAFSHPGVIGTATSLSLATTDGTALNQYTLMFQGYGDSPATGYGSLEGANSTYVNNSNITDTGSTGTGYNVFDLSSNSYTVDPLQSHFGGSANTVTLTGTGQSIITNYKVMNDTVTTVPTHGVILNAVDDGVSLTYYGTGASTNAGQLNVNAFSLGISAAAGVDVGATFASAVHVASTGATGWGIVVLENATTHTSSVYLTSDVAAPTANNSYLEAVLVGVTPASTLIHLV